MWISLNHKMLLLHDGFDMVEDENHLFKDSKVLTPWYTPLLICISNTYNMVDLNDIELARG